MHFTDNVSSVSRLDFDECYKWILHQTRQLSWTPGIQRSLIMIGDGIPHEVDYSRNKDNIDWRKEADGLLNEHGVRVYAVQCQAEKGSAGFRKELSDCTHCQYLKLDQFDTIIDILMAICYRERGVEHFKAYEKEVRTRDGKHMPRALDSAFDVLRGRPGTSGVVKSFSRITDLSKGARKIVSSPKPITARRNALSIAKRASRQQKASPSRLTTSLSRRS